MDWCPTQKNQIQVLVGRCQTRHFRTACGGPDVRGTYPKFILRTSCTVSRSISVGAKSVRRTNNLGKQPTVRYSIPVVVQGQKGILGQGKQDAVAADLVHLDRLHLDLQQGLYCSSDSFLLLAVFSP